MVVYTVYASIYVQGNDTMYGGALIRVEKAKTFTTE